MRKAVVIFVVVVDIVLLRKAVFVLWCERLLLCVIDIVLWRKSVFFVVRKGAVISYSSRYCIIERAVFLL